MQINNINYQQTNLNKSKLNNNRNNMVNFTGIGKFDPRNLKRLDYYTKDMMQFVPNKLCLKEEVVNETIKCSSKPQRKLLAIMADKFNGDNFYKPIEQKEDPNVVLSLVDKIQFPTSSHFRFVNTRRFNLTEVAGCMEKLNYNPSKISRFHRAARDIGKNTEASSKDIMSILNSKNSDEYLKKYSVYEPYFKRHITEPDAIKKLDEMVTSGTYDAVKEQKTYELEKTTKDFHMTKLINVERLAPHSSKESNKILGIFSEKLTPARLKDTSNYSENLAKIYSTTTKDNFEARSAYLDTYMSFTGVHEYSKEEMNNITKLFKRMDEDPSALNFVKKVSVPQSNTVGAGGFLRILDEVTPKKRELYSDNIREIMSNGTKQPVEKAIRLCSLQPDSTTGKLKKGIKSFIGSIISDTPKKSRNHYKRIEVAEADKPEIIPLADTKPKKAQSNLPAIRYRFPQLDLTRPVYTAPALPKLADIVGGKNKLKFNVPTPVVTKPVEAVAETAKTEPEMSDSMLQHAKHVAFNSIMQKQAERKADAIKRNGIFVNRPAKQPSAQKLQVISDVNNLIENKLGKNTLADQSKSYSRGATKMRLSMLPEIFESIKETRAQKRAAGTFNKHKSESNADALTLYNMINGKNKKLVNYMLKVRDENGSIIYSVKDIIATVGEKEKEIRLAKLHKNPIPPAETKAMYASMFDEQVAQYGKLPRAKKK